MTGVTKRTTDSFSAYATLATTSVMGVTGGRCYRMRCCPELCHSAVGFSAGMPPGTWNLSLDIFAAPRGQKVYT